MQRVCLERWPRRSLHFRFRGMGGARIRGGKKKEFPTGIAVGKRREKGNDDEVDYDRYFC